MNKIKNFLNKRNVSLFLLVLILLQFVPIDRTNIPHSNEIKAPTQISSMLKRACYDCHSTVTDWPWYSYVFPVSLLVSHHIEEGREELNFSEFENLKDIKKISKLESMIEEIEEQEMPPGYYLLFHKNAHITKEELTALKKWKDMLEANYVKDK
ncbi:MAG: heme-binding domain-containing protein [Leptospiraceae bacterium]|nr:heme-binding domain-containing protein [Leptospiraceae bacterium]